MEVDKEKETAASFDHLPNEVLLMIFRLLNFRLLIQTSSVSHRWNQLIFHLLRDRVALRVEAPIDDRKANEWIRDRTYTELIHVAGWFGLPKIRKGSLLQPLVKDIRKLQLISYEANDGDLVDFLRPFGAVETLILKTGQLQFSLEPAKFLRSCQRLLPNVRHLDITCRYVRLMGLLEKLAPRLVTLELELLHRLLPNLYRCRFDSLETFTLRFRKDSLRFFRPEGFSQCMQRMKNLRKFALYVEDNESFFYAAYKLMAIEHLTIGGSYRFKNPRIFSGVSNMKNLRSLSVNMITNQILNTVEPLPSVEKLIVEGTVLVNLRFMTVQFPNLRELTLKSQTIGIHEIKQIVLAWQTTIEDLTIKINTINRMITSCFTLLEKLRKICFYHDEESEIDFGAYDMIAAMSSLRELHIRGHVNAVASLSELTRCQRTCAILINDRLIEDVLRNPRFAETASRNNVSEKPS